VPKGLGKGCIEGMRCPQCGNHEEFMVSMTCMAMVGEDGTYDEQDMEWDGDSLCICPRCDHNGRVSEFEDK
jgi:hypothetical protein